MIKSVQSQTYKNWELLLVDDCSTDKSLELIESACEFDSRIQFVRHTQNLGAAKARNTGLSHVKGRFLCFLDSDDFWPPQKLKLQLEFMLRNDYYFTFTSYELTNLHGLPSGKQTIVPRQLTYQAAIKRSSISTCAVMIDLNIVEKYELEMPNYKIGEDTATWWHLLKNYGDAFGLQDVLLYYRRGSNDTLSANKFRAMKWRWKLYREQEGFNIIKSSYCFANYAIYALQRRV